MNMHKIKYEYSTNRSMAIHNTMYVSMREKLPSIEIEKFKFYVSILLIEIIGDVQVQSA